MASTRLPGKPLAHIAGRAMILHVLDRAREADIGPVAVACADEEIADAVRADGGVAVMTDPSLPSRLRPRARRPGDAGPAGRARRGGQPAGRLPDRAAGAAARRADPAVRPGGRHRHPGRPDRDGGGGRAPPVVKAACAFERGRAVSPALYFSRAADPVRATGRCGTISASTPIAGRRWPASSACRNPAGAARKPGTAARAGGRDADRLRPGGPRPVRRGHAGGPGTRPRLLARHR